MFRSILTALVSVGFGLGIGLGVAVSIGHTKEAIQEDEPEENQEPQRDPVRYEVDKAAILRLVRSEIQGLGSESESPDGEELDQPEPVDEGPLVESPEEAKERISQEVTSFQKWFESEAEDARWSRAASESLTSSLLEVPETSYELLDLDCRTAVCKGVVEWENSTIAKRELSKIAEHPHETNCATGVYLADETDPAGAVRAEVFFDCTEVRAGSL